MQIEGDAAINIGITADYIRQIESHVRDIKNSARIVVALLVDLCMAVGYMWHNLPAVLHP